MSEELKEGPYHEYNDHGDFNCEFCMTGEDAAYYSNLMNKVFHSRDAEVLVLKQHAELDADVINQFKAEVAELRDKMKEAMRLLNIADLKLGNIPPDGFHIELEALKKSL